MEDVVKNTEMLITREVVCILINVFFSLLYLCYTRVKFSHQPLHVFKVLSSSTLTQLSGGFNCTQLHHELDFYQYSPFFFL